MCSYLLKWEWRSRKIVELIRVGRGRASETRVDEADLRGEVCGENQRGV